MDLCIISIFLLNCIILLYYNKFVYSVNDVLESLDSEYRYTSVPSGPKTFKIVTLNDNGLTGNDDPDLIDVIKKLGYQNFGINDSNKYDVSKNGTQFKYELKPGVKCVVLYLSNSEYICKHKVVWQYDSKKYGMKYPTEVYFDFNYRVVEVVFNDEWYYTYTYDDRSWGFKLDSSVGPPLVDTKSDGTELPTSSINISQEQPLEIVTLDEEPYLEVPGSDDQLLVKSNDTSKYNVVRDGLLFYFDFVKDAKCVSVKFKGVDVWNFRFEGSQKQHPKTIVMNNDLKEITILFIDFYLVYSLVGDKYLYKSRTDLHKVFVENLVVVTEDNLGGTNPKENDTSQYDLVKKGNEVEYRFKEETKCVNVKYEGKDMWSFNDDSSLGYPKILSFDIDSEVIFIGFDNGLFNIYGRTYGKFGFITQKKQIEVKDNYMKIYTVDDDVEDNDKDGDQNIKYDRDGMKITNDDNSGDKDISEDEIQNTDVKNNTTDYIFSNSKIINKDGDQDIYGIYASNCRIRQNDSSKYRVTKYVHGYVYELKPGIKCVKIVCDGKEVWKYDQSKDKNNTEDGFPRKITLNFFALSNVSIIVHFEDKDLYYKFKDDSWKMYFSSKISRENKEKVEKEDSIKEMYKKHNEEKDIHKIIKEDELHKMEDNKLKEIKIEGVDKEDKKSGKTDYNEENKIRNQIDQEEMEEDRKMRIMIKTIFEDNRRVILVILFCGITVVLMIVFYLFYKRYK